ncbi:MULTISPECIES: ABC transporter substrate-binding protein [Halanaerobium]|jgi:putative ABC transport system substrate-binding protein|uniref:Putative ABC transport system substrate-binding protein n=2 Tax=Halanaerobium TaxID=2330 RepID=A0A1G9P144_9FIRM|nr:MULTISPECIES: ABC transporter substrate-binding protein [Halanaerobium]PTV99288.1 putative ABC transport system substrate-binding protein [Halanaerobium saccharolyticum]PXV69888.1 putative ABC transport system substrate-binding protein [Halanaerobium congolense]TDP90647.1 putative ABC transport system substrate-binding protein [Halanaerobium saccharolyticum]TDX48096.1 putative ABC transport system substrate-binding protein [Halanaerobium congolense]SDK32801.1 putative ABC transport system s
MKNILKKSYLLVLIVLLISSFSMNLAAQEYEIGISQFVEHPSLDLAREGFIDQLAEEGFVDGENIEIDLQNAQADFATAQTIAQRFNQNKVDLVLAIATPSAQTAANVLKNTPVLITAVTDPVEAGIVKSMEKPGANITGTTDMNPVAKQLELIRNFLPEVKDIGILYNPGEVNSTVQVKLAKEKAKEMGVNLEEATVSNSSEVSLAVSSLVDNVDAIYVPTDNIIVSAMPTVLQIAHNRKIPVFASENNSVEQGAVATLGIDYYQLGRQTGSMAARILNGSDPAKMPVESSKELKLYINQKSTEEIGLEIPAELLESADTIFK